MYLKTNLSFISGLDLSRYVPRTMFSPNQPIEKSTFCYDLYAVSVSLNVFFF